jgi:two-component system response regulator LytT
MKILYRGPQEDLKKIEENLKNGKFEFVLCNEDFELKKSSFILDTIISKLDNKYVPIHHSKIIYVESYGHDVVCHTQGESYRIQEKLYEIEGLFEQYGFIRIHKSYVINKHHISSISPMINRKFKLKLSNNDSVEVSRKYYSEFKRFIGMRG